MMSRSWSNWGMRWDTRSGRRSAFVLMEILVALAVLILGMTVIGAQLNQSWKSARTTERDYTAILLAETKMAEFDTGLIIQDEEVEGDWGALFPRFAWRIIIEPSGVDNLLAVTIQILFEDARRDIELDFDFEEAVVLYSVYTLRAVPARLDLTRDFGISEEAADKIAEAGADSGADVALDPRDLDPAVFRDMPLEDLIEILPSLLQAMGMSMEDLMNMLPPEARAMIEATQGEFAEEGAETGDESADDGLAPDGGGPDPTESGSGGARRIEVGGGGGGDAGRGGGGRAGGGGGGRAGGGASGRGGAEGRGGSGRPRREEGGNR
jgi:uncharacterized membrane protein YgcG